MDMNDILQEMQNGKTKSPKRRSQNSATERLHELFNVKDELGAGAYGTVWRATKKDNPYVFYAVKHISKKKAGQKGMTEVLSEVETLSLLNHPNIVRLEDTFKDDLDLYIVMECIPGGELAKTLKAAKKFPEDVVRRIALNLLLAVEYIHSKGIVHRDLKPANCLLNDRGDYELKIADFGFAVMVGQDNCLTSFCGTTAFMAPEIIMDLNYGKPVDMWAVGVIIYLCLCGDYPFSGSNHEQLAASICGAKYSFNGPTWEGVSAGAKDLISKMFVVDQNRRITAKLARNHHWVRAGMTQEDFDLYGEDDGESGPRKKPARLLLRGGLFAVAAAHRLLFLMKCTRLRRDGIDYPILRSYRFMVGRTYEPASMAISASGLCPGNARALQQLTDMLESSDTVESFDVSSNHIDQLDLVQHMVKVVSNHRSLTSLNLENNPIPPLAGRALLRLARQNTKLRVINVNNTAIGAEQISQIAQALKDVERKRGEAASSGNLRHETQRSSTSHGITSAHSSNSGLTMSSGGIHFPALKGASGGGSIGGSSRLNLGGPLGTIGGHHHHGLGGGRNTRTTPLMHVTSPTPAKRRL